MKNGKVMIVLGIWLAASSLNGMHDADPLVQPGFDVGIRPRVSTTRDEGSQDINVYSFQPGNGNPQPHEQQVALGTQSWKTYRKRKSLECGLSLLSGVLVFFPALWVMVQCNFGDQCPVNQ